MTHRTLFQNLVVLKILNLVFFNRIANDWNGLPNQITVVNQKVLQGKKII